MNVIHVFLPVMGKQLDGYGKTPARARAWNGCPTPDGIILVYAHRAVRGLFPEHTLPAYTAALRIGCDYVDMDVNMTKDGVLAVTHDLTLNPDLTRNKEGVWITEKIPVNSITFEELREYNVGMTRPGSDYARLFPNQRPLGNATVPGLRDVVQHVKTVGGDSVGFQIEMKTDPARPDISPAPKVFAEALCSLLRHENIIDRTEVQAFDWRCLVELAKLDSEIKTAFLTDHTTQALSDDETGLWTAGVLPKDHGYSFPRMIKSLGGHCWEPYERDLTRAALDEARAAGLKVVVWNWPEKEGVEFDYETVRRMIEWGVDGIITDRIDILHKVKKCF